MPGIGFLFWNVDNKPLDQRVGRIAASRGVDVVMVCEHSASGSGLVTALDAAGAGTYSEVAGIPTWPAQEFPPPRVFSRLPGRALRLQFADPGRRWLVYRITHRSVPEFFLTVAHMPSKVNASNETQAMAARRFAADIDMVEGGRGHRRTVVVGDLNMNPFEPGVAGADALHGVSARAVAGRGERVIQRRGYPMFYNPMWGVLGDRTPGPPGTYYRGAAEAVNYFWNTYDQVLVRPELMDRLADLAVLDSDGTDSLVTRRGAPARKTISDHLPLCFRLDW